MIDFALLAIFVGGLCGWLLGYVTGEQDGRAAVQEAWNTIERNRRERESCYRQYGQDTEGELS